MDNITILKNKIEAVNELHSFINKVTPLVIQRLQKGFKQKTDFSLFEKDKKDIDNLIGKHSKRIRCYIIANQYNICLQCDTHYRISDFSVNYYNKPIYVYDSNGVLPFVKLKDDFKIGDILLRRNNIEQLEKQIEDIQTKLNAEKVDYFPFFNGRE
jgi:hypothetical protein